jgi:hypothetical protein
MLLELWRRNPSTEFGSMSEVKARSVFAPGRQVQLAQAQTRQPVPDTRPDAAPAQPDRAQICADGACVFVKLRGGGLTDRELGVYSSAYREFILKNGGRDLAPYAADVSGSWGSNSDDVRRVYIASQFVGANLPAGWGNTRIYAVSGQDPFLAMGSEAAGTMDYEWIRDRTPQALYIARINMDWGDHRTNPSGLARTMIHEYLHRNDQMGMVTLVNERHLAIDAEARHRLVAYGLGGGGCLPVGGALWGLVPPTFPGCR